jgi:[protein-PII] uridylyltransferase
VEVVSDLDAARHDVGDQMLSGGGGVAALERFAAGVDLQVQRLCAAASLPEDAAIVALGGYGRGHLCPYSDIDLLVLFGHAIGAAEEQFLRGLLHPLWDEGFTVGQQVREAGDFAELEVDNPEFLLAFVDARIVCGNRALFERCRAAFHVPRTHAHVLEALQTLVDQRHASFNGTLYQLEPDVKDAPGALRDIAAARTIAAITDPALLRRSSDELPRLAEAEDFLLRVRTLLHLEHRRNHNVLGHAAQEKIAERLGYPGRGPRQRVEALMADYFRHARIVSRVLDRARRTAPVPLATNIGGTRDGIRFIDERRAAIQPASWLAAFQAAIDTGSVTSDEALACVRRSADRFKPEDFFPGEDDRAALLNFLKPRPGLYARLSEMHDAGLLARMLPPLQPITYRVVRDFYHKYTVDEHTLLTIRNLERLGDSERVSAAAVPRRSPGRERFAALLRDLESPELLVLALLLHDAGKWRDEDHAAESVRMAQQTLETLRLPAKACDTVLFLIEHHLRMSQVAFRRDTEDPEVVRAFAELVGVEERLKLLCLMTLADIEAVSPDTLTPWKEELLWRLYVDTYNHLTLGYGDDLIERTQTGVAECVARRPADLSAQEVAAFLEGLPRRYLRLFDRDSIYRHIRLARGMRPDEVHLELDRKGAVWELTVVTLDKPMLFSNISGVLSSFGMDILRGQALTNPNGLVLDVFQFSDAERFLSLNADASAAIQSAIRDVVAGRVTVAERLRGRRLGLSRRRGPRAAPVVHSDDQSSRRYTIVEIVAPDEPGLLYRISRTIAAHRCEIDLVLIATEAEKAIDVFHITRGGAKLTDSEQRALAADLLRTLEDADEAVEGHHSTQ